MTGFAQSSGMAECGQASGKWTWEVRSVNAKSLEVRPKFPAGFDAIEIPCRKQIGARFSRGFIQASLQFESENSHIVPMLNQPALNALLEIVNELRGRIDAAPPSAEAILGIRGILEYGESAAPVEEIENRNTKVLEGLDVALEQLESARQREGGILLGHLFGQIDQIEQLIKRIEQDPARNTSSLREKLREQVRMLLDEVTEIDSQRLYQEAAMLAVRFDICEEIDRLGAHVDSARSILQSAGPVGRKLDFLSQELNRECNTICSKSNSAAVTAMGLDMKAVIEQFREQIQNIE
jgi:uncharacterized protein (TIGR00255 family)